MTELTPTPSANTQEPADQTPHLHGPGCSHGHHHDHDHHDDHATQPFVRTHPKVGRNDPCPCGSQKKFKKCCGSGVG